MTRFFPSWDGRARWWVPLAAVLIAAGLLVGALASHRWLGSAVREQRQQQRELHALIAVAARAYVPVCASEVAYAQALPLAVSIDRLVQSLQESSRTFGVAVLSVSSEPHVQTPRMLAQIDVSITLHGGYGAIKSTLSEALARYPSAVVERLRMKRASGLPIEEDADLQIVLPVRPDASVPGCRTPSAPGA